MEVCCPWDSPLSEFVERAGGRAVRLGIHNGYDLSTKAGFTKALARLQRLRPRYLHVSPPCDPWSTATNGHLRDPQLKADREAKRVNSRKILKNCLKLVEVQRQEQRHAGGEQPLRADSWKEPHVRKMVRLCGGERFRCDGCRFGMWSCRCSLPIQKPWGWFSSDPEIYKALHKPCQHGRQRHAQLHSRETSSTATYPPKLCKAFAKALVGNQIGLIRNKVEGLVAAVGIRSPAPPKERHPDPEDAEDSGHLSELELLEPDLEDDEHYEPSEPQPEDPKPDPKEPEDANEQPGDDWQTQHILKKLRVIHANLGHPSNQVLCRMLKEAGASSETIRIAEKYECPHCAKRGHAQPHRTSQVPHATRKWEVVSVDTFWWHSPHKDEL